MNKEEKGYFVPFYERLPKAVGRKKDGLQSEVESETQRYEEIVRFIDEQLDIQLPETVEKFQEKAMDYEIIIRGFEYTGDALILSKEFAKDLEAYLNQDYDDLDEALENHFTHFCNRCGRGIGYHHGLLDPQELKSRNTFLHCNFCLRYDLCMSCSKRKKMAGNDHSHHLEKTKIDLFNPSYPQQNILSFQGGGIRGYLSLLMFKRYVQRVMQFRYPEKDKEDMDELDDLAAELIDKKYDLVCGTSIGGIIAILLCMRVKLSELFTLFETQKDDIFLKFNFWEIGNATYRNSGIHDACVQMLLDHGFDANTRIKDLELPCAVTTYDVVAGEVIWITNQEQIKVPFLRPQFVNDRNCVNITDYEELNLTEILGNVFLDTSEILVTDAVIATSAAPTFFPRHDFNLDHTVVYNDEEYTFRRVFHSVDGGIWGNDPSLFALLAQRALKRGLNRNRTFNIYSFGTGTTMTSNVEKGHFDWDNSLGWMMQSPNIIEVILQASSSLTDTVLNSLRQTGTVNFFNMNVNLTTPIKLDDKNTVPDIQQNAVANMTEKEVAVITRGAHKTLLCGINDKAAHEYDELHNVEQSSDDILFSQTSDDEESMDV